jgi:hypothetical protein
MSLTVSSEVGQLRRVITVPGSELGRSRGRW